MSTSALDFFESHPMPSPLLVPVGPDQLDRIEDDLHLGWAWQRYQSIFRRFETPRILDAGCGTGLSTLGLARLNPKAQVVGLEFSRRALEIAKERLRATPTEGVTFEHEDLEKRLPAGLGFFDFIVCRGVLGWVEEPITVLKNLARHLDPRGLLLTTFRNRGCQGPIRQFRQAILALSGPIATLEERAALGQSLFHTLRPDHSIRRHERLYSGETGPSAERVIEGYLGPESRDWSIPEAVETLKAAGLKFLYAASSRPWQSQLVFQGEPSADLKGRVGRLDDSSLTALRDALDPTLYGPDLRLFACLDDYEPAVPNWFERIESDPTVWERLAPHRTGLADPVEPATPHGGLLTYRAVSGAIGPIDERTHSMFQRINGLKSCAAIDNEVQLDTGTAEQQTVRSRRWLDLANHGFILLEPLDARQQFACVHQGAVLDRLDCACARRWVRRCELHGYCTIDPVPVVDDRRAALELALVQLKISEPRNCANCPDFESSE